MKAIAYYLPQFHEIPENDEWWGKGFTEWTNTKKAKPIYKWQYQPKVPLEGYYCLDDKDAMMHQAELANKYNIYGMAFYHYWFEGKMLLQRPAENLLKWTDIPMNFMFFWANHTWNRSWNGSTTVLMAQTYGGKEDWENHFNYMLPFFKDERYIKINGCPAFGIYVPDSVPNFDDMAEYWNKLAVENGFPGIYMIETALTPEHQSQHKNTNAIVLRPPNIANRQAMKLYSISKKFPRLQKFIPGCYPGICSYEAVLKNLIQVTKEFQSEKDLIYGYLVGWDNTCRHGRRGSIMKGQTPEIFKKYLTELNELAKERSIDYVFINAWNEWAEGMYLEPDTKDGFAYLEAVRDVLA